LYVSLIEVVMNAMVYLFDSANEHLDLC